MDKNDCIDTLVSTSLDLQRQTSFQRSAILKEICTSLAASKGELAQLITEESKKPIKYAMQEVSRSIHTFEIASEEAKRKPQEFFDLDWTKGPAKQGIVKCFPIGPVIGITPFNFPLNLVAHKLAPAIAAGCPILIKPSPKTPNVAHQLIEIANQSGTIPGSAICLELSNDEVHELVQDDRFGALSFTGSAAVGWQLKNKAGKKRVTLELGGNAGAILTPTADLEVAVKRCTTGGFAYSGQVCIHTQRIYVHHSLYDQFVEDYLVEISKLKLGDLMDPSTDFGEMITEESAIRLQEWIDEAIDQGATLLTGGKREGSMVHPTVLTNTLPSMRVVREEVFGPVVIVEKYQELEEAVASINDSSYGLQAGIFTDSQSEIQYAFHNMQTGAVIVNDVPTYRADQMPYGGIKDSGFGREGVKYAIRELMEPRLLVY